MDGSVKWGLSVLWVALAMRTFVAGGSQVCNITADEMNGLEALFYSTKGDAWNNQYYYADDDSINKTLWTVRSCDG
jgi:hypothetical protein